MSDESTSTSVLDRSETEAKEPVVFHVYHIPCQPNDKLVAYCGHTRLRKGITLPPNFDGGKPQTCSMCMTQRDVGCPRCEGGEE